MSVTVDDQYPKRNALILELYSADADAYSQRVLPEKPRDSAEGTNNSTRKVVDGEDVLAVPVRTDRRQSGADLTARN